MKAKLTFLLVALIATSSIFTKEAKVVLTKPEFNEMIKQIKKSSEPCVLIWYNDWCSACIEMKPTFEKAMKANPKNHYYEVNAYELNKESEKYDITFLPTVIINIEGKEVFRIVGLQNEDDFLKKIKEKTKIKTKQKIKQKKKPIKKKTIIKTDPKPSPVKTTGVRKKRRWARIKGFFRRKFLEFFDSE